jgi:hypothetical protein
MASNDRQALEAAAEAVAEWGALAAYYRAGGRCGCERTRWPAAVGGPSINLA